MKSRNVWKETSRLFTTAQQLPRQSAKAVRRGITSIQATENMEDVFLVHSHATVFFKKRQGNAKLRMIVYAPHGIQLNFW